MAKVKTDLRDALTEYRFEFDLLQKIPCSASENKQYYQMQQAGEPLPKGVYNYVDDEGTPLRQFYTIYKPELTPAELSEYLAFRKLKYIKTIRNCAVFFTTFTIISIIIDVLLSLA